MGRRPSLTVEQQGEARRLVDDAGQSLRQVAAYYGVSKDAVSRAVAAARETLAAAAQPAPPVSSRPAAPPGFPHETVTVVWQDSPGGGGGRRDVRRTRTVRVAGVPVQVDERGQVYCDGCLDWIPLDVATARGSAHRAVPGRSFAAPGLLRPLDGGR